MVDRPDGAATVLARDVHAHLHALATRLQMPLALLSRDAARWRFHGEWFPSGEPAPRGERGGELTAVLIGWARGREWLLLLAGGGDARRSPSIDGIIDEARGSLRRVLHAEEDRAAQDVGRQLYASSRRLGREHDSARLHALVLRTVARSARARIGALALYRDAEHALAIVATHGYPVVLVDHLRIVPGDGILGRAYTSGKAAVGSAEGTRRLRYHTTSFLQIPLTAGTHALGVITLTDREDGEPFDARDLANARILAALASLALAREDVQQRLSELQRMAAIDPVTGLFNRRHFEARLLGEIHRVQRQLQDLALLMVDVDDFKRINDTFGHLEGDRTLRTVADLLKGGVRIFDVCARYGGEEFAILMPGASLETAGQVAERIRRRVHRHFRHAPAPVTVSIGVARLAAGQSGEDLVAEADRRLGMAKRAGKNTVEAG